MGKINYRRIYDTNRDQWKALTSEPQKYEALLAGHYSERNHFVYELLQNAEDESAKRVVIEYYDDRLVFYHNGNPFDEDDVEGVSSMLKGTKDRNSAQTIGRFGMGFKSVFKYTYQPEIYSDDEAFIIENYLLPSEISDKWDYRKEKEILSYKVNGRLYKPFAEEEHLTKIIIPFLKRNNSGDLVKVSGHEVLQKLEELTGEILLFLNHVQDLYWINKRTGKFAMITLVQDDTDQNLVTCRINKPGKPEEVNRYLKFKNVFDHPEMEKAEVSVAYRVNNRVNNISEIQGTPIWVYFPTREITKLPFYIHGSFETAVSREKLMTPSAFNDFLFDRLGDLITESLGSLKNRKLITQGFIRRVILTSFKDESENETIKGLRTKITNAFRKGELLPNRVNGYSSASKLKVAVPFEMADFTDNSFLGGTLPAASEFVVLNNERESNFTEYYVWLTDSLGVRTYTLADWAKDLRRKMPGTFDVRKSMSALEVFYGFLFDKRESLYSTGLSFSRSGRYEQAVREQMSQAWDVLRQAPIILNAAGQLCPAYKGEKQVLYLNASNDYQTLHLSSVVHQRIAEKFERLLLDGFKLSKFDNYQYVKEKLIKKYIKGDHINFENDDFTEEYVEDLNQILSLFDNNQNPTEILDLLQRASVIKIASDSDTAVFAKPREVYIPKSDEGMDLAVYYSVPESEDDDEYGEPEVFLIDENFYNNQGVPLKKLYQFGLITTPVNEGRRSDPGGPGQEAWRALGEYCPHLNIDYLDENLRFIENNQELLLSRKKSAEIFHLLLGIYKKLAGTMRKRKTNPYEVEGECYLLIKIRRYHSWLYDKDGELCRINEISKYDLDTALYGELISDKQAYTTLGFIETEDDSTAEAFDQVDKLDRKNKAILIRQLAKELGLKLAEDTGDEEDSFIEEDTNSVFKPDEWVSEAFPVSKVRNMDSLIEHVRQQFFCADPVTYRKVLRQIRTSKSPRSVKAYVTGMYINDSNIQVCQMCKKPSMRVDATEIANYGIELPQLHLCLCRDCSAIYKSMRDVNKEPFKEGMKQALLGVNLEDKADEYELQLNAEYSLHFTETHVAEIQTIFGLLSEYGIPGSLRDSDENLYETELSLDNDEQRADISSENREEGNSVADNFEVIQVEELSANREEETEEVITETQNVGQETNSPEAEFVPNMDPINDGNLVSYKKMNTLEIVDTVIDSTKYPLHKSFLGKKIGDIVVANGKRYLIISIL